MRGYEPISRPAHCGTRDLYHRLPLFLSFEGEYPTSHVDLLKREVIRELLRELLPDLLDLLLAQPNHPNTS